MNIEPKQQQSQEIQQGLSPLEKEYLITSFQSGMSLEMFHTNIKSDPEMVIESSKVNIRNLFFASEELKSNKEFMKQFIEENGNTLFYASSELQNDKELALIAIRENGISIQYVSPELQHDNEMIYEAVKQNPNILYYLEEKDYDNKDLMIKLTKITNAKTYLYVTDAVKNSPEFLSEIKSVLGDLKQVNQLKTILNKGKENE